MRRFELILAVATVFAVGWPVVFGVRPRRGIVAAMLSIALLAQLQFEGFRWQMIPLYMVAIGLAIGDVFFLDRKLEWSRRLTRGILGVVGLLLAATLPVVLPVPEIPTPSGPGAIGTMTVDLIDRSRDELYGPNPGGPREFVVQVWYPTSAQGAEQPLVWSNDWEVVAPAISRNMGFPSWFLNHTQYSLSHARPTVPVAPGNFPVVVFSHGWQGVRTIALNQVEHLVSNGYVVVAPDHTYVAAATVLEDGEVALQDSSALPDPAAAEPGLYEQASMDLVATLSGDLVTILDELEAGEEGAFAGIAGSIDLGRIGIYGHSAGGGAAVKTCLEDARCSAVLGMDPWVEPLSESDLRINMAKPALYMRSGDWLNTANDGLLLGIAGRGEAVTYMVDIPAAAHNDFLMTPLLSPVSSQIGLTGDIPGGRMIAIADNYVLGFFDVFLLGTGPAALDSVTFPEASVSVIDP